MLKLYYDWRLDMANIIITNISKLKENAENHLYSSDCGEILIYQIKLAK